MILQINKNLLELFQEQPMTAFKVNKNLKEIIGGTLIGNGKMKVKKFNIWSKLRKGKKCFFKLNCKSECVVYLMKCILSKIQYVGKAETTFSLTLNNPRKHFNLQVISTAI